MRNWIELNITWNEFLVSWWCKSGVLVRTQKCGLIEEFLIGDINVKGGQCNCCSFDDTDDVTVLAVKVVTDDD